MNPTRRLTHNDTMELNNKNLVVGFLQAPLAEDVIQQFENAVEGGREHSGGYIIQVDRTVRSGQWTSSCQRCIAQEHLASNLQM